MRYGVLRVTVISFGGLWSHCDRGMGTRRGRRFRQRAPPPPPNSQPPAYQPAKRGTRRDYSQFRRDRCSRPSRARTFVSVFVLIKNVCSKVIERCYLNIFCLPPPTVVICKLVIFINFAPIFFSRQSVRIIVYTHC